MPARAKYAPLGRYLADQPPGVTTVTLTLAEVERIINAPLPPRGLRRQGWSNSLATTPHAWVWLSVGWRVRHINRWLHTPMVVFVRADTSG